jgi:hypothetical protein
VGVKSLGHGDTPGNGSGVLTLNLVVVMHTLSMVSYDGAPMVIVRI